MLPKLAAPKGAAFTFYGAFPSAARAFGSNRFRSSSGSLPSDCIFFCSAGRNASLLKSDMKFLINLYGSIPSLLVDELGHALNYGKYCWDCGKAFSSTTSKSWTGTCYGIRCAPQRRLFKDKTPRRYLTRVYLVDAWRDAENLDETQGSWVKIGIGYSVKDRIMQFRLPAWRYRAAGRVLCSTREEALAIERALHARTSGWAGRKGSRKDLPSNDGATEWFYVSRRERQELSICVSAVQAAMDRESYDDLYYPSSLQVALQFVGLNREEAAPITGDIDEHQ